MSSVSECTAQSMSAYESTKAIIELKTIIQVFEKDVTERQNNQVWGSISILLCAEIR